MLTIRQCAIVTVLASLSGCACNNVQRELERVAKDWSMVIRASQVIPVYPLTEDLQPGDVFLVQQTVDKQHTEYKKRGFLPLDNMIWRINPANYEQFYRQSFGVGGEGKALPQYFMTERCRCTVVGCSERKFPHLLILGATRRRLHPGIAHTGCTDWTESAGRECGSRDYHHCGCTHLWGRHDLAS